MGDSPRIGPVAGQSTIVPAGYTTGLGTTMPGYSGAFPPPIPTVPTADYFVGQGSGGFDEGESSLWTSDDNVTFHQVLSSADMAYYNVGCFGNNTIAPIPSIDRQHKYWRLRYLHHELANGTAGLRYYAGVDYTNCYLLSGHVTGFDSFCTPAGSYTNVWAGIPFIASFTCVGQTGGVTSLYANNPSFTPGSFGMNATVFQMTAINDVVITSIWTVTLV